MQYAHCHNYSKWCLTRLLRKEHAQKTELIVTRYPPDIVLNKGSDKCTSGCLSIKILKS